LQRQFEHNQPDHAWVTDITYIRTQVEWLYLAVELDLHSHAVVGWSMDSRMQTSLELDSLTMAVWRRRPKDSVIIHSDQGSPSAPLGLRPACVLGTSCAAAWPPEARARSVPTNRLLSVPLASLIANENNAKINRIRIKLTALFATGSKYPRVRAAASLRHEKCLQVWANASARLCNEVDVVLQPRPSKHGLGADSLPNSGWPWLRNVSTSAPPAKGGITHAGYRHFKKSTNTGILDYI
jgi:hypothetical protein